MLAYNHTALVSGAERSLLDLLAGLAEAAPEVEVTVAVPAGPLRDRARGLGLETAPVRELSGSFKLHPVETPRALADGLRAARDLRRAARDAGCRVVHANSVRAGLIALAARAAGGPPVVVHVRDVLPESALARALAATVRRRARRVIAISRHTAASFGADRSTVVHNPVDLTRFDPAAADGARFRAELGIPSGAPLLVVVGQITAWKGQDDAIEALRIVRESRPEAHLAIVGEPKFVSRATRFDNRAFEARLRELAREVGNVHLTGERDDVPHVMAAADLVLVPSWEEPFGRTVVEAMALGRCVLATSIGGPAEIVTDGVDGRLLAPKAPRAWGRAVLELLGDDAGRERLAAAARIRARDFDRTGHARRVAEIYADAATGP